MHLYWQYLSLSVLLLTQSNTTGTRVDCPLKHSISWLPLKMFELSFNHFQPIFLLLPLQGIVGSMAIVNDDSERDLCGLYWAGSPYKSKTNRKQILYLGGKVGHCCNLASNQIWAIRVSFHPPCWKPEYLQWMAMNFGNLIAQIERAHQCWPSLQVSSQITTSTAKSVCCACPEGFSVCLPAETSHLRTASNFFGFDFTNRKASSKWSWERSSAAW